jgi:hypothetical protein
MRRFGDKPGQGTGAELLAYVVQIQAQEAGTGSSVPASCFLLTSFAKIKPLGCLWGSG